MRAIVQDRYGPPEVLELREVDRPVAGDDQVCVEVRASSLNIYDWHMTTGTPYMARAQAGLLRPKHSIPGGDVAGVVVAAGKDATRLKPGDEVFGFIGHGAFAEYVCSAERRFAVKPAGVTFEQAAATPLAGVTALQGLRDVGGLRAGERVLINGASGGVGTFAVQIARALGATVTAVCSTAKVETARSLGADSVIDYTRDDFVATERGYDLLFDNAGNRPWSQTKQVLTATGRNVAITGPKHAVMGPMRELLFRKVSSMFDGRSMTWFTARETREAVEELAGMLASGAVVPVVERTYALEEVPDGMRYLGEGHAAGKLVVTV